MKITSSPAPASVPERSKPAALDAAAEGQAFKDRLSRVLADPGGKPPSIDFLQAAFAGPTLDGVKLSDLERSTATELLQARQSALGQTVADAREARVPIPPAVEELLDMLQGVTGKVGAPETPSDAFDQGTTEGELQAMKDLLAGRPED